MSSYAMEQPIAIRASESARAAFIRRTYGHLAGAILAFVCIEFAIFSLVPQERLLASMQILFQSPWTMLLLFGAFIGVGWLARVWASSEVSQGVQYLGLGIYVVFEALIFVPILYVAEYYVPSGQNIIPTAGIMTLGIFGGLTMAVFVTRKDFSFLGPILCVAGFLVLGLIVAAILIPNNINLGLWFSFLMVAIASAYILYDTSNVLHHFRTDQHVAASLELFASVALLFYYILRILIALSSERR